MKTTLLALALILCSAASARAHKPSDSYLTLRSDGAQLTAQWDIALRDLDQAIGLDSDGDGAITWGEVRARQTAIDAYALARLHIAADGTACTARAPDHLIDRHSDGAYAVLRFAATCPAPPRVLEVGYRLFFDIDPQHRGLLNLSTQGATRAGILSVDAPVQQFTLAELGKGEQFIDYVKEGVLHIWTGFDHILFLLSLLLPAVLVRSRIPGVHWTAAPSFNAAFWDVFKVVTAFTVAHSITLSLAALGVISLPSRLTESAIAASVILAALNNVRPVVYGGRWLIAFGFGLIHGFGFASVLTDLGLPQGSLLLALVAFNLGVELGQLVIVSVFLPIAYALRKTALYQRVVLVLGSAAIALIAGVWLVERVFDVKLIGF